MSKRHVEQELESLNGDLLADLSPEERIQLFAVTIAEGNDKKTRLLRETIPKGTYRGIDPVYRSKVTIAQILSWTATYGLHLSYLEYALATERGQRRLAERLYLSAIAGDSLSDDAALGESLQLVDQINKETSGAAADLYIVYHANRRFAEECLEVDLEQFLALSAAGWYDHVDFGAAVAVLEDAGELPETVTAAEEEGTEELSLDEAIGRVYDDLVREWSALDEEPAS